MELTRVDTNHLASIIGAHAKVELPSYVQCLIEGSSRLDVSAKARRLWYSTQIEVRPSPKSSESLLIIAAAVLFQRDPYGTLICPWARALEKAKQCQAFGMGRHRRSQENQAHLRMLTESLKERHPIFIFSRIYNECSPVRVERDFPGLYFEVLDCVSGAEKVVNKGSLLRTFARWASVTFWPGMQACL
eukprot:1158956-Pelagomonas_calceolata.AAC.14